jgi:hypothetical protein
MIVFFTQCSCSNCGKENEIYDIPPKVVRKANTFIKSKTGESFFSNYVSLNMLKSKATKNGFFMHYNLRMLEKDFVDEDITFRVDSSGNLIKKYDISGIPNCIENPKECEFNLTKKEAIKIAKEYDLPDGIRDWEVSFRYSNELDRYVWHILATTSETKTDDTNKAQGEEIMIDPADGEVLKHREWNIF